LKRSPALVIFDCDGVLVDSEPIAMRVLLETVAEAGLHLDEAVGYERLLGRSLANIREILAADFGIKLGDDALAGMRCRLYSAFRAELQPIPGIAATLDDLRLPFCVASSSQPERIEVSLRAASLWPHFEGRVFSATQVARGKPAPDLFLFAAENMGFAPEDCLVVEDSPAGIAAAQVANMQVVGFLGGSHARRPEHRAAIDALAPSFVIDEMAQLIRTAGLAQ
jgi:HAD superfamily hydrolase (TIGR01509 family)